MSKTLVAVVLALALPATASGSELSSTATQRAIQKSEEGGVVAPTMAASATTVGDLRIAIEGQPPPVLAGLAQPMESAVMQANIANEPIEAVTMKGNFTLTSAKTPHGYPFPKGKWLTVGVDLATQHAVFVQLGNKKPILPGTPLTVKRGVKGTGFIARRIKRAHAASGWNCFNPHCYSIAIRPMSGNEMVVGSQANHANETMSVEYGGMIDEEEWATFDEVYWIEGGQEAGDGYDCCSIRWFYAWNKKRIGYQQYIHPPGDRWPGGNYDYYLHYTGPGAWGFQVGGALVASSTGLRTYSTELQVGNEYYSINEPFVASRHETNEKWIDWTTHEWAKERWYVDAHICQGRNPYSGWKGNTRSTTC